MEFVLQTGNSTGRMLWFETADLMHYPPFVDKTLKLFNLKQVAHELETSVMSKVSCTACKAGKLLFSVFQNYFFSRDRDLR